MALVTRTRLASVTLITLVLASCKTPGSGGNAGVKAVEDTLSEAGDALATANVFSLPTITKPDSVLALAQEIVNASDAPESKKAEYAKRAAHYFAFLGLKNDVISKKLAKRVFEGSSQFILCDSFEDWACTQAKPWVTPKRASRRDAEEGLGDRVDIAEPLKLKYWFTEAWDIDKTAIVPEKMLAKRLAETIEAEAQTGMSVAIYGIDATDGSMKPVYDAIMSKIDAGIPVRGVFDQEDFAKGSEGPFLFSYSKPTGNAAKWIFSPFDAKFNNLTFQYKDTMKIIERMNQGAKGFKGALGRLEFPDGGIMHNKFVVFEKEGGRMSVWSGTANVADTCMGTERNTNLGILIDNTEIAREFQKEFDEMYEYQPDDYKKPEKVVGAGGGGVKRGRFHNDKTPNTKRYFRFSDGTEMNLSFAPTDDGEHRSILPMLLSARPGDEVRVSMFGGGGIEFVRAFQYAQSKGADVRIVFDTLTGSQVTGWIRDKKGNVLEANPYQPNPSSKLVVRRSTWKKQNHHKVATLTRKTPSGPRAEYIIIGSQNWSVTGNDDNDENMVTIRAPGGSVAVATAFNDHFDNRLWKVSAAKELKQGIPYADQTGDNAPGAGDDTEVEALGD